jgi:hypothetical protein
MIRSVIFAVVLLSSAAAAMRLDPLALSSMVDDRRPVFIPIPSRGEHPRPLPIALRWPQNPHLVEWYGEDGEP